METRERTSPWCAETENSPANKEGDLSAAPVSVAVKESLFYRHQLGPLRTFSAARRAAGVPLARFHCLIPEFTERFPSWTPPRNLLQGMRAIHASPPCVAVALHFARQFSSD